VGDHHLSVGYDKQKRSSTNKITKIAGDHFWTYNALKNGATLDKKGIKFTNTTGQSLDFVTDNIFIGGGSFYTDLQAYYIEDEWQLNDRWLFTLGLRVDKFDSYTVKNTLLSSLKTNPAPRFGFSWDMNGDGSSKLYGTWGHYYLPISNNTIFRAASGNRYTTEFYTFSGIDSKDGSPTGLKPITGDEKSSLRINNSGVVPERALFQAKDAKPFSKEEFILGYEHQLTDQLSIAFRATYRRILTVLDDYCGPWAGKNECVMLNPGQASTWSKDASYWNGEKFEETKKIKDGIPDKNSQRLHTVAEIALPNPKHTYQALQTTLKYSAEKYRLTMIYSLSKSQGNTEGAVKSDNGQSDAGATSDWDFPALMDGAYGYLPNDRRHTLKLFGNYSVTEDFSIGFNALLSSGRPLNQFGQGHPSTDPNLYGSYGDSFYLYEGCDFNDQNKCIKGTKRYSSHPRGSAGRTPWIFKLDLSANYLFTISGMDMKATLQVFNILNSQAVTSSNEHYETSEGIKSNWYGAAYTWQTPRYVSLGLEARF
jgi:hypothetical protein